MSRPPLPIAAAQPRHGLRWAGLAGLIVGLMLGVIQPIIVVYVGAGVYAGPTYVGLLFLLCIAVVVLLGVVVVVVRGARQAGTPVVALAGCLALGILAGNVAAGNLHTGWAARSSPEVRPTGAGWADTGRLVAARSDHTATVLSDGRVLVAGGRSTDSGGAVSSAELYDPATGRWTATGTMPSPQADHVATLLADGRVLVTSYSGEAMLYDPATGTWSAAGPMGTARRDYAATVLQDGRVLVSGGRDAGDEMAPSELFEPAIGAWSSAGAMRVPRAGHTATLLSDGRVLVAGGTGAAEPESNPMGLLADAEIYDPATNAWTASAPMLTRRSDHAAVLLGDGRVLIVGGNGVATTTEAYDPRTATWGPAGPVQSWMRPQAVLLGDGRVLVVDGLGGVEVLDPARPALPVTTASAGRWHPAVALLPNGKVLFAGGYQYQRGAVDAAHLYDPGTVPATTVPTLRSPAAHAVPPGPTPQAIVSPSPSQDPGAMLAERIAALSTRASAATSAIPRKVPQARRPVESLEAYTARAQDAATKGAGGIRDLVEQERRSLATLDTAGCPAGAEYRLLVGAYAVVANAIWAAFYGPDAALLQQGLADLERLNASLATAAAKIEGAADACTIAIDGRVATLASRVIGTQSVDIVRSPDRLHESAMGNLVADAMRSKYPDVDAALLNSGGLRADLVADPPTAGEQPGEITWGELLAVLPFGNRTAIVTVSGEQLLAALGNGFAPACDPAFAGGTGRFPQLSGLRVRFHCDGTTPVVDNVWRATDSAGEPDTEVAPTDRIRLVTADYLLAGGDGYALPRQDVREPGDMLLGVAMDYATASSPLGPAMEGRIVGP